MTAKRKANAARRREHRSNCASKDTPAKEKGGRGGAAGENAAAPAKNFPCAVYSAFFGRTGPMTFVSKEWELWTGYSSEEICHNPQAWPRCIHPEERQRAISTYDIAGRDETPYSLEYVIVHKDTGQVRYVRDQGLLSEDTETDITRVDGFVTDITELRNMENELAAYRDHLQEMVAERTAELSRANKVLRIEDAERRKVLDALSRSEDKFRTIFENVTDVISYLDTKGRVLEVNDRIEEMLGYRSEEVIGKNFASVGILGIADTPRLLRLLKDTILRGEPVSPLELQLRHKNGEKVTVEVGTKFITHNSRVKGIVAILKDVTERRRAEQAVMAMNRELEVAVGRLTAANRELVDFAHVAAHDLKAPLRGIGGLAGIMAAEYGDVLDEEGNELLRMLVGRASRMYKHIDNVLEYSQIGRSEGKRLEIDLYKLLREIVDSIAPPENIKISISKRLPVLVFDKTAMVQIFQNLLDNAIKYMDKPQGRIRVDCARQDQFWKFSVADNGCGIDEKYFDKIFQMFQTLVSRDEIESTGIGLSVVRNRTLGGKKDCRDIRRPNLGRITTGQRHNILLYIAAVAKRPLPHGGVGG
ncbi:MAG: sensor histidine kinase [Planctomycetota bacterium]|jgi:PAS domain S-box-containing protein